MKRTAIVICVAALIVAAVAYWLGQRRDRNSNAVSAPSEQSVAGGIRTTNRLMRVMSPRPAEINVTNLDGTIEHEFADANLREKMNEWSREGWTVLSISDSIPQEDGTFRRRARLRPP